MISKVGDVTSSSVLNIRTLTKYLRFGHKDEPKLEQERVQSFFTLNLYAEDLETATEEMMFTASLNSRSKCSKYMHLVLSLSEGEKVDDELWKKITQDYLEELKMSGHQVIAVRHNDNGLEHLHLVINRIDSETHNRTNSYNQYLKLPKFDKKIEEKYGLKQFDHKVNEPLDYQQIAVNKAKNIEKKTEHQSLLSYLLERKEKILTANTWKELKERLAEIDCQIAVKGRGLVIRSLNPEHPAEVKASSFDRSFSYAKLVKKFGLFPENLNDNSVADSQQEPQSSNSQSFVTDNSYQPKETFTAKPLTKNAKRIEYTAYFFKRIEDRKDKVLDKGDRLIVKRAKDYKTIQDILKIAKKRFGNGHIKVSGNRAFQKRIMMHALKMGIDVKLEDPSLQKQYNQYKHQQENQAAKIAAIHAQQQGVLRGRLLTEQEYMQRQKEQELIKAARKKEREKQIELMKQRKLENVREIARGNQQHTKSETVETEKARVRRKSHLSM